MSSGTGGGHGGGSSFAPREDLAVLLTGMGLSRNAAVRGLYYTGNSNADLAAAWIFENQDRDLDAPLEFDDSSSEDDVEEIEGIEGVAAMGEFLDESDFYKMVFVVNSSLVMGVGKVAAQVGHAAIGLFKVLVDQQQKYGEMLLSWEQFGETKIVLKGNTASHLAELAAKASAIGLPHYVVEDAGKTQIPAGSITVLGIMGKAELVNQVTESLSLL